MVYYFSQQTNFLEKEIEIEYINKSELLDIINSFRNTNIIALDCETNGLNPFINDIVMLQLGNGINEIVIDTRGFDFSILKEFLECKDITFVGHNIKFDYNMLKKYNIFLNNVYDTMVIDRVIHNGRYSTAQIVKEKRYSLAGVYKYYFDKTLSKTVREEFSTWGSKPFTYEQIKYGALDVRYPLEIRETQLKLINKYNLTKVVNLENATVLVLGDIEYNGFYIDKKKWLNTHIKYKSNLKNTLLELDELLIAKDPKYKKQAFQLNLFSDLVKERLTNVNWNSDIQVYKILTNTFKIYPEDKDGKPSSGTPALEMLDERPPFVEKLIQFRVESKIISSFGEKFLNKHISNDSRLRTYFNQIVNTGRVSSRNPNMQQIPAGDEFRGAFIAPEGKDLITADYANQEGRIMAAFAKDDDYINFFNNGDGDVHSFVATKMFSAAFGREFKVSKTENEEYRQKGKILNFMISFGGSAFTLSKTLKITIDEAEKLIQSFYEGFPTLKTLFNNNKKKAITDGVIRTNPITNRIRWIPEYEEYKKLKSKDYWSLSKEDRSKIGKLKGSIERKGMNTPIQGQRPCLNHVNCWKTEMSISSQV